MDLGDMTLPCMTFWTLCRRSTSSGVSKQKVSKANGIKVCWLSEHVFSCLTTLFDAAFKAACPKVKDLTSNPTSGETPVKSTQACFPPTHPYTITSTDLSVDLLSSRSVEVHKRLLLHWYSLIYPSSPKKILHFCYVFIHLYLSHFYFFSLIYPSSMAYS